MSAQIDAPAFATGPGSQSGDRFLVSARDQKGERVSRAFGVEPLRQYLVETESGRFQVLQLAYDPAVGEWFDVYGNDGRQPGDWRHWTGRGMNWNSSCAVCHNTALEKHYDTETDSYATTMAEMGVGCEACHGPMAVHVSAAESGNRSTDEYAGLSDQQILQYIFRPGFSTADAVTNLSGRGVGLDVVRSNLEKIGGTVDLRSEENRGSTFTIKIPLTLAIVSALIVEAGGERFAIPQIAVSSLVGVSGTSEHRIETLNDTPFLRVRDRLLPLVSLSNVLALDRGSGAKASDRSDVFVIVTQVGNYEFGIIVDRVFDTEEIVVKPAAPILRHIDIFSGNTILGDGSVIMILDPSGLAAATGEVSAADTSTLGETAKRDGRGDDVTALLVFRAGGEEAKAVPLALVARLEEIATDSVEISNGQLVVQYRGELMPLIKSDDAVELKNEGRQPILVFTDGDQSMGLIVDEIMDIVEEQLNIELSSSRPGRLGSVVVAGKATELIDTGYYLIRACDNWFDADGKALDGKKKRSKRILLVDDSPFFRNLLKPLLAASGYSVTTAESPDVALTLREDGEEFDIIISDIEMPGMTGYEFVEAVKKDARWQNTPVVALSSYATPEDFDRGREAGFCDYVAKSDRDALLHTLSQTLASGMSGDAA